MKVDICFAVNSPSSIKADHAYVLYSAISAFIPWIHAAEGVAIHPISGCQIGNRRMAIRRGSRLAIRIDANSVVNMIPLAGKRLDIGDGSLILGTPTLHRLYPANCVRSRIVTIKGFMDPDELRAAIRRQLACLGVRDEVGVEIGKRRTVCIKGKEIVGFETVIFGLSDGESIAVLESGVGGRQRMGCGVFSPLRVPTF